MTKFRNSFAEFIKKLREVEEEEEKNIRQSHNNRSIKKKERKEEEEKIERNYVTGHWNLKFFCD